jgi:hypothetical protein
MPRDGSGIYHTPVGTDATAFYTAYSAQYNVNVHDVEADLNGKRPIIAGGTGSSSAGEALVRLSGEQAYQTVVDYDTFVFSPGSFKSAVTAFNSPVAGHAFSGICTTNDPPPNPATSAPPNVDLIITARDTADGTNYVRRKTAGVWSTWTTDGLGIFVHKTGDIMSGGLVMDNGTNNSPSLTLASVGYNSWSIDNYLGNLRFHHDGTGYFNYSPIGDLTTSGNIFLNNTTSDSPNIVLNAAGYNDWGIDNYQGTFRVFAAPGVYFTIQPNGDIFTSGDINVGSDFGVVGVATIGGNLDVVGTVHSSGPVTCNSSAGFFVNGTTGTNPVVVTALRADPAFPITIQGLHFPGVWAGWRIDSQGALFDFRDDSTAAKTGGSTSWVIMSDARTKTVTREYTSGLNEVAALRPVRYVFKGNDTIEPPPARTVAPYPNSQNYTPAYRRTEYIGLVAQDAELAMPELISKSIGHIDGFAVSDLRSLDPTALVFALVNAVKELKARLETIEAVHGTGDSR